MDFEDEEEGKKLKFDDKINDFPKNDDCKEPAINNFFAADLHLKLIES